MLKTKKWLSGLPAVFLLAACGGAGDFTSVDPAGSDSPSTPGVGGGGTSSSDVASISFTQPLQNAIEDRGNGDYRQRGKVDVVNRDGRAVADGTTIDLILLDTVILQDNTGVVSAGSLDVLSRSGPSLITTRCSSQTGAEASGCDASATSSFTSTVVRSHSVRAIQPGDFVILRNTDPMDRFRRVLSVDGPTSLRLDRPLAKPYSGIEFWIGTAASGMSAAGLSSDGTTPTPGVARTVQGEAEFRVTYPANAGSLGMGCFGYGENGAAFPIDLRDAVPQSRQVLIAATAPNGVTAVNVGSFCANGIAGGQTLSDVNSVTLNPPASGQVTEQEVSLTFRDGGQKVRLAYETFRCVRTAGPDFLTIGLAGFSDRVPSFSAIANVFGEATIIITRSSGAAAGGDGAVTCVTGDESATKSIGVVLPDPPAASP